MAKGGYPVKPGRRRVHMLLLPHVFAELDRAAFERGQRPGAYAAYMLTRWADREIAKRGAQNAPKPPGSKDTS